jgi:hypothetical protein
MGHCKYLWTELGADVRLLTKLMTRFFSGEANP